MIVRSTKLSIMDVKILLQYDDLKAVANVLERIQPDELIALAIQKFDIRLSAQMLSVLQHDDDFDEWVVMTAHEQCLLNNKETI